MARDMAQIELIHKRSCPHPRGRCRCKPSFRPRVWDSGANKLHARTFKEYAAAKA